MIWVEIQDQVNIFTITIQCFFVVEMMTKKILDSVVLIKCTKCDSFGEKDHDCYANLEGSSKEMKPLHLFKCI